MPRKKSDNRKQPAEKNAAKHAKREKLSKEKAELKQQLSWSADGFDVEVVDGPAAGTPERPWNLFVVYGAERKVRMRLRQKATGVFYWDRGRGEGGRPSTGVKDVNDAIAWAEARIREARAQVVAATDSREALRDELQSGMGLTYGQIPDLVKYTDLNGRATYDGYVRCARIGSEILGPGKYIAATTHSDILKAIEIRLRLGSRRFKNRPLKRSTAVETFQDLATVIGKIALLDPVDLGLPPGTPVIPHNPFADGFAWPDKGTDERRHPLGADAYRLLTAPFEYLDAKTGVLKTLPPPCDVIDPTGRLRLILAIAHYLGRRFDAIAQLRVRDYVTDIDGMRAVMRRSDFSRTDWVESWENGLFDFLREYDKEDNHWPVPVPHALKVELDLYFMRNPKLRESANGPLFPNDLGSSSAVVRAGPGHIRHDLIVTNPYIEKNVDGTYRAPDIGLFEQAVYTAVEYLQIGGRGTEITKTFPLYRRGTEPEYESVDAPFVAAVGSPRSRGGRPHEGPVYQYGFYKFNKVHCMRHGFSTAMEKAGWTASNIGAAGDRDTARLDTYPSYLGSWNTGNKDTRQARYTHMDGELIFACANQEASWDARKRIGAKSIQDARDDRAASLSYAEKLLAEARRSKQRSA